MRNLVHSGKKSPRVRQTAVLLTQNLPQKDHEEEIKVLYRFVRDRIRYVRDVRGVETLHTADRILENKQGDCDDKSILLASLLESLGHTTRFTAIGFSPSKKLFGKMTSPGYSHVLPEVLLRNGDWLALETTEPVGLGWFPNKAQSLLIINN